MPLLQLRVSYFVFEGQHNDDGKELKIRVCSHLADVEPGIAATGSISEKYRPRMAFDSDLNSFLVMPFRCCPITLGSKSPVEAYNEQIDPFIEAAADFTICLSAVGVSDARYSCSSIVDLL
jgi:hypothetical protein